MLKLIVSIQMTAWGASDRVRARLHDDRGQSTAEYALVLLGAAGIAILLAAWATKSGKVGQLLNSVIGRVLSMSKS